MLKNAIAYAEICDIYANICEFLHMQHMRHMRHNFRISDSEKVIIIYAEKYAICGFWQNMRSHVRSHIRIYPTSLLSFHSLFFLFPPFLLPFLFPFLFILSSSLSLLFLSFPNFLFLEVGLLKFTQEV